MKGAQDDGDCIQGTWKNFVAVLFWKAVRQNKWTIVQRHFEVIF